jgi:hypothetical protein
VERFVKGYGGLAGTVLGFIGRLLISPADDRCVTPIGERKE